MKKMNYLIFSFLTSLSMKLTVFAKAELGFCDESGIRRLFKILGLALYIIKIAVPILLIVFGLIEMANCVISSDADQIKKSANKLVKKILAGVIIFIIPTLIDYAFNVTQKTIINRTGYESKYNNCVKCFTNPNECKLD